jgi:hypothetical protein
LRVHGRLQRFSMAASVVAGPSSRPDLKALSVVPPLQTYATDHDSAEQALPGSAEEIQSQTQIRNRMQQGQAANSSAEQERRSPEVETGSSSRLNVHNERPEGKKTDNETCT